MIRVFLLSTFLSLSAFSYGQSGTLKYAISIETSDPEMQMLKAVLLNSTMEIYFSPSHTALTLRLGTISMSKTVTDLKAKKSLIIVESQMGNFFANSSLEENVEVDPYADMIVNLVNETKIIAGLECKKALIIDAEGNESTVWYAPKLNFPILNRFDIGKNAKIPGAMVEFEMAQQGFVMKFSLMSYSDKVDNPDAFNMKAPEGYTEMAPEYLKQFGF
jgi:hypothetical protein